MPTSLKEGMAATPQNGECGIRYKFWPRRRDFRPRRYAEMDELLAWCEVFDREGMAPVEGGASAGNLSFRTRDGYVITPTRSQLKRGLPWDKLIEVVRSNWLDYEVHYLGGGPPSSDAFLHERIYVRRPDVNAVFHGHDDAILEMADQLGVPVTGRALVFGTREDADETSRELGTHNYMIRRGHGFIAVGSTLREAGERSLEVHRRAVALQKERRGS